MDLSKSINAFVQVVIWICQNWYMDFSVVGLGRLCHWQCFVLIRHDSWGYLRSKLPDTIFWTILTLKTKKTYNCTWCLQHLHAQRRAGTFSPFKFGLHLSRGFSYFQITYILVFGKQPPKNMTKKSVVNNDTQKSYCSSQPSMVNWLSSSIFPCSLAYDPYYTPGSFNVLQPIHYCNACMTKCAWRHRHVLHVGWAMLTIVANWWNILVLPFGHTLHVVIQLQYDCDIVD